MDDPRLPPDMQDFARFCQYLLDYATQRWGLTEDEGDGIVVIVAYRQHLKRTCPYEDLDDLTASIAVSKLPSSFD